MIELAAGEGRVKSHLYGQLLRSMLEDQLAWVRDHSHRRRITEENGRDSLAIAWEADRLAHGDGARASARSA